MKKYKIFFFAAVIGLFVSACQYDFIVPEESIDGGGGNGNSTVSFKTQIVPIFTTEGCVSCHKTGGQAPDLTADKAYGSLAVTKYVNVSSPADSYLYKHIYSDTNAHKHHKFTATEAQLIYTWIEEGAQNN